MLCLKTSSKLDTVETDDEGFPLLVLKNKVLMRKKKAKSRITDDTKMHVRSTRNTMNPMVNTTLTSILR